MSHPPLHIDTDEIDAFEPQTDRLVSALLGHSNALVTDLSDVGDFMVWPGRPDPEPIAAISALMGRPVTVNDRLVDLARELATKDAEANASRH